MDGTYQTVVEVSLFPELTRRPFVYSANALISARNVMASIYCCLAAKRYVLNSSLRSPDLKDWERFRRNLCIFCRRQHSSIPSCRTALRSIEELLKFGKGKNTPDRWNLSSTNQRWNLMSSRIKYEIGIEAGTPSKPVDDVERWQMRNGNVVEF
jgi:hypothetical protein